MSETTTNATGPAKTNLLTAAIAKRESLATRLTEARAKHQAAEAKITDAQNGVTQAVADAVAKGTDADTAVMLPLQQAQMEAALQARMVEELERQHAASAKEIEAAKHQTGLAAYLAGIQIRIAAGKKAEEARELLAQAQREHQRGTGIFQAARQQGTQHPGGTLSINPPAFDKFMTTEESERNFWNSIGASETGWDYVDGEAT